MSAISITLTPFCVNTCSLCGASQRRSTDIIKWIFEHEKTEQIIIIICGWFMSYRDCTFFSPHSFFRYHKMSSLDACGASCVHTYVIHPITVTCSFILDVMRRMNFLFYFTSLCFSFFFARFAEALDVNQLSLNRTDSRRKWDFWCLNSFPLLTRSPLYRIISHEEK